MKTAARFGYDARMPLRRPAIRFDSRRRLCPVLLAALLTSACPIPVAMSASPTPDAMMAEYRRKLAEYTAARQDYEEITNAYWKSIAEKRRLRNNKRRNSEAILLADYVLTQPPVYAGPPKPIDPSAPKQEPPPIAKKYVPVVADFLRSAAEQFNFIPRPPDHEIDYKRAYVKVASAAGLSKEQVVRIYGFEAGGNGGYDVQAGLEYDTPGAQAISTALGYNQLLATNSVELLAEQGDRFIDALRVKMAGLSGEKKSALAAKLAIVQRMVAFTRTVPDDWSEHEKLADTPQGLGVHALLLDIDVGPLLQTQKLLDSIVFARKQGYPGSLTAAELEMMNLTGDGNGFDMVTMPASLRTQVPTANFFQPSGYRDNPVAIRNNTVAKLLAATDAKMDSESKLQGAKDMAAAF
jgi:hypothetical protein